MIQLLILALILAAPPDPSLTPTFDPATCIKCGRLATMTPGPTPTDMEPYQIISRATYQPTRPAPAADRGRDDGRPPGDHRGQLLALAGAILFGAVGLLLWRNRPGPLSPEEKRRRRLEKQQAAADRARIQQLQQYAKLCEPRIQNILARRDLARVWKDEKRVNVQYVRFDYCVIPWDGTALLYHIDGQRLPRGVLIEDILGEECCAAIGRDIGRAVRPLDTMEKCGAFLQVIMGEGVSRLPNVYLFHKPDGLLNVMDLLPKTRPSYVAVGMGENRNLYTVDYRHTHLLVGGATGWGKTNWIRQALVSLVLRLNADQLRVCILDFKQGAGLRIFADIPQMLDLEATNISLARRQALAKEGGHWGFVDDKDRAMQVLGLVLEEMDARYRMFGGAGCEDIDGYNRGRHNKMADILVVIDELADLMMDPDRKREYSQVIERMILRVAQQGRGAGIYAWVGTQTPRADVITPLIKYNLVHKIAFNCTHASASRIILDNGMAVNLPVRGRMVFQEPGMAGIPLQAPLLEHDDAKRILAGISENPEAGPPIEEVEIWRYSLANLAGDLPIRHLYDRFPISQSWIRNLLSEYEYRPDQAGPVIQLDGQAYIVLPSNGGNKPRKLYAIDGQMPTEDEICRIVGIRRRGRNGHTTTITQTEAE